MARTEEVQKEPKKLKVGETQRKTNKFQKIKLTIPEEHVGLEKMKATSKLKP